MRLLSQKIRQAEPEDRPVIENFKELLVLEVNQDLRYREFQGRFAFPSGFPLEGVHFYLATWHHQLRG